MSQYQLGIDRDLMAKVKHKKLIYFGHVMRVSAGKPALMVINRVMKRTRARGAARK